MSNVMIPEGYKQTEVGVIPENWEVKKLGELLDYEQPTKYIINGKEFLKSGTTPVLTAGKSFILGYTEETHGINTKLPVIIFDDFTTATQFVSFPFKVKSSAMKILRPKSDEAPISLIHSLLVNIDFEVGDHKRHWIGEFSKLKVGIPNSLKEQTAIATALSDIDNLIQSLEKLIDKKEAIKTGTMQQLLTGKTRLPEFATREDGNPKEFKQTELGRIPEDWDLVELRDLLSYEQPTKYIIDGNEFLEDGTTPVLTAGKSFILGYTEETHGIYRNLPTIIFDDFTTATQFVNFPFKVKSSAMKILKPKSTSIPIQLIYLLLSNIDYKVGDHKRHWISEFSSLKVSLPNSSIEQTAIATILSDMDAEIQTLQQRLEKTRDIKQGMMQQLLTGKVRLVD
ncbi:restriction endonuclease subunit S [Psychrobacter sp. FBL11]|uniref:Restriction endonuclease subunit S n=1 Tax=Psychrobacter saeujeotis TaxID=3143436 RepID=A0ABU9X755_9GAMM|nr:restriction endonuclease subunit S [uncultured Psychrobacter sp.]